MVKDETLRGRVCLVTGAGRGFGRAYALALAAAGAKAVVVNDLGVELDGSGASVGPAEEVAEEVRGLGVDSYADGTDISDWNAARSMVDRVVSKYGHLDVLVNNAGIFKIAPFVDINERDFDAMFAVNCKGTYAPALAAATHWKNRIASGEQLDVRLINISSSAGLYAVPAMTVYGGTKAAVASFTQAYADEVDGLGITVNAVAPGGNTRLVLPMREAGYDLSHMPSGDDFAPEAVAPLIVWLASPDSRDVTGQIFEANGKLLAVVEGNRQGPRVDEMPREHSQVGDVLRPLLREARPRTARAKESTAKNMEIYGS